MGVPISFLDKYNPDQFEIIANGDDRDEMEALGVLPLGPEQTLKVEIDDEAFDRLRLPLSPHPGEEGSACGGAGGEPVRRGVDQGSRLVTGAASAYVRPFMYFP
jgi:hypothetical protein